jgi:hypothetical protein
MTGSNEEWLQDSPRSRRVILGSGRYGDLEMMPDRNELSD